MTKLAKRDYFVYYIYFFVFITPLNTFKSQLFITTTLLLIGWLLTFKENEYIKELKRFFTFTPLLLIIVFILYNYLSLFWSVNLKEWFQEQSLYKYYFIIVPVIASTLTAQEAKNSFKIFILSIGAYAVFSILIYLGVLTITKTPENPYGTLLYAVATPFLVIGFFSSILLSIYDTNNKLKYIFYFIAFVTFVAVFIQNGRSGQVAFFGTLAVFIAIYIKKLFIIRNFIIASIAIILSISGIFLFEKDKGFSRGFIEVERYMDKGELTGSWGARLYLWTAAIDGIEKNPIFGVGAGGNLEHMREYKKEHPLSQFNHLLATHNLHLDILLKYGIFGYILFVSSIALLIVSLFNKEERLFGLLGVAFFCVMFFSALGDDILLIKPFNNVFINIFIILSIIAIKERKMQKISI